MNSVDTGWVTDEDPVEIAERKTAEHGFRPPLDIVDGAARIVDPVIDGFNSARTSGPLPEGLSADRLVAGAGPRYVRGPGSSYSEDYSSRDEPLARGGRRDRSSPAFSSPAFAGGRLGAPPGATARCRDGSYSYSLHHLGTCSYHGGVAAWLDGSATGPTGSAGAGAAAIQRRRPRPDGAPRTRTRTAPVQARQRARSTLLHPAPTTPDLTAQVICAGGFHTSSIRNVTQLEKFAVEREYGMPAPTTVYTIEIDHIVPLELGGSNVIARTSSRNRQGSR